MTKKFTVPSKIPKREPRRSVSVRLPESLVMWYEKTAEKNQYTFTDLVERVLKEYKEWVEK